VGSGGVHRVGHIATEGRDYDTDNGAGVRVVDT